MPGVRAMQREFAEREKQRQEQLVAGLQEIVLRVNAQGFWIRQFRARTATFWGRLRWVLKGGD